MKTFQRLALPVCALALILLLLRERPEAGKSSVPAGHVMVQAPSVAAGADAAVTGSSEDAKAAAAMTAAVAAAANQPLPRTVRDLNTFTDSPKPLVEKMALLDRMMREDTPEHAKAAAVRAVFIVKNLDFKTHLLPVILAGKIKPEAMDVLALNLYDRPLDVLLPAWGAIRDLPGHPLHEAAVEGLAFHLKDRMDSGDLTQVIKDYLRPAVP